MASKKRTWPRREADPHRASRGSGEGGPRRGGTRSLSPHPRKEKEAPRLYHDAEGRVDTSRVGNHRPPPLNSSDVFGGTLKEAVDARVTCPRGQGSGTRHRGDTGPWRARDPQDKPLQDEVGLDSHVDQKNGTSTEGTLLVVTLCRDERCDTWYI